MNSKLDTHMNRSYAMVVKSLTSEMIERAKQLEHLYPDYCWISDISTTRDDFGHKKEPTFYYFLMNGKYWVNEEWIKTGEGSPTRE
jgi:hypothetical protein